MILHLSAQKRPVKKKLTFEEQMIWWTVVMGVKKFYGKTYLFAHIENLIKIEEKEYGSKISRITNNW